MNKLRNCVAAIGLLLATTTVGPSQSATAASANELNRDGRAALDRLLAQSDKARRYAGDARAILVFPRIVKAGLVVGGQSGEGVLFVNGQPAGYYRISAVSYGMQVGGQRFAYALFFMNDGALDYLNRSDGWAIGTGPSVVVLDEGAARGATSTTLRDDVVAFPFNQRGLMAGTGLEGSKITKLDR
jgi:lipid-binding SYLF domain-containing protein